MRWPRPRRSRADRYESVRVHRAKYLDTLLLLKLTITPFASVGYHGGRWSTLEVRPHYTWPHTHTHIRTHTYTHTHTHTRTRTYPHNRTCTRFYRKASAQGKEKFAAATCTERPQEATRILLAPRFRADWWAATLRSRSAPTSLSRRSTPHAPLPGVFPVPSFIRRRATSRRCPGVPLTALTGASPFFAPELPALSAVLYDFKIRNMCYVINVRGV